MSENNDQKRSQEKELTGLRKLAKRRWFYPALYLGISSLILIGVLFFQMRGNEQAKEEENRVVFNQDKPSSPTNADQEVFEWPAAKSDTQVIQPFYDVEGSEQEQEAALVNYNQTYIQNTGINIGAKDEKAFAVNAAMSGKVTEAKKDNLLGYVVTLKHENGVETMYQSLDSVNVKLGEKVSQGDKIGTAGTEALNKKMGTHVHFEIRKNGLPVNPEHYFSKGTEDIKAVTAEKKSTSAAAEKSKQEKTDDKKTPETTGDAAKEKEEQTSKEKDSKSEQDKGTSVEQGSVD
ncbi:M23 family metallopeptidase [Sporolactobacillus sp. THM7-7]|nr:M23 family metallopeptidase [Sporolactobacillus sp. THM7-7]